MTYAIDQCYRTAGHPDNAKTRTHTGTKHMHTPKHTNKHTYTQHRQPQKPLSIYSLFTLKLLQRGQRAHMKPYITCVPLRVCMYEGGSVCVLQLIWMHSAELVSILFRVRDHMFATHVQTHTHTHTKWEREKQSIAAKGNRRLKELQGQKQSANNWKPYICRQM